MKIHLFGGFELRLDGVSVPRPRTQVCELLAILAIHERMSVEGAIEQLWPGALPGDPRATFRVLLSRTRAALRHHRSALSNVGGTLCLEAECDVVSFRTLVASSTTDPHERLRELEHALVVRARGPVAMLGGLPGLVALGRSLTIDERRAALEIGPLLVDAGRASEAVPILEEMWGAAPDDEPVAIRLARAHAHSGDRPRALDVLTGTQAALRDRHGMSLSDEAESLLYELLRGDLDFAPSRSNVAYEIDTLPIVGVDRLLRDVPLDGNAVAVLEGHPGDGKSTLASVLATRLSTRGFSVIAVVASSEPARPMQVVADIVTELLTRDFARVAEMDPQTASAVERLLPQTVARSSTFAITRESLVSLTAALIVESIDRHMIALMIDDVHECDWATCEVLQRVLTASRQPIVLTTRVGRPAHVSSLVNHRACRVTRLESLDRDDVEEFVRRRIPGHISDTDALFRRSGGHPLFLSLLVQMLIDGDGVEKLPSSVLVAVRHRTGSLSHGARAALSLLTLFPRGISEDFATRLRATIVEESEELRAADLLSAGHDLRVRHALVADAVQQVTPDGVLIAWQDEIGWLLEGDDRPVTEWVEYALAAVELDPLRAVSAAVAAAQQHTAMFAWERVLQLAQRAQEMLREYSVSDSRLLAEALLLEGRARRALMMTDSDDVLLAAIATAIEHGHHDATAQAVIEMSTFGRIMIDDPTGAELHEVVETLLEADLPKRILSELQAAAGTLLAVSRLQQRGRELFLQGYQAARVLADPDIEQRVLMHLNLSTGHPRDLNIRLAGAKRLREIAGADPDLLWEASYLDFGIGLLHANRALVDRSIAAIRELTPQLRIRDRSFGLAFTEASYMRAIGDLSLADSYVGVAAEIGRVAFPENWVKFVTIGIVAAVAEERGSFGSLLPFLDAQIVRNPAFPTWHAVAAAAAASQGDSERVSGELRHLADTGFDLVPDISWLAVICLLAEPVALVGDRSAAELLMTQLEPFSGLMAWNGITVHRPVDHYLATYMDVTGSGSASRHRALAKQMLARMCDDSR